MSDALLQGCFAQLTSFMKNNFMMIGGVAIGFSFLQVRHHTASVLDFRSSLNLVASSHQRHGQDKTAMSCLVGGVNKIGDKSRLFSVVLNMLDLETLSISHFEIDSLDLSPVLFTPPT